MTDPEQPPEFFDRQRRWVELKLAGEYTFCPVIEWHDDDTVTVMYPSGSTDTVPIERICG